MARQMEAVRKDCSPEEPGGDGESEQAAASQPWETSLTSETGMVRTQAE